MSDRINFRPSAITNGATLPYPLAAPPRELPAVPPPRVPERPASAAGLAEPAPTLADEVVTKDQRGHAFSATELASSGRTTVLPKLSLPEGATAPRLESSHRPRYREHARLGAGGIGEVMLALDEDIGRQVAIKRLHRGMDGSGGLMRFVDEVQVMGRLDHPNIVPVHDVGCDQDGRLFFVMKRLEGDTLETIIERLRDGDAEARRSYPISVRVEIMMGVLRALQFAHAQRTIHRDLKPANIMVGRFGEVCVLDWGIAKRVGDPLSDALDRSAPPADEEAVRASQLPFRTRVGSLLGTPAYMSPEQARGDNDKLDVRSDIFSASLVFYELLTLEHPFADKPTLAALLEAIRTEEPVFMPLRSSRSAGAVPVELANVIHRGLAKQREDRFGGVGEMIEALHDVEEGAFPVTCPVTLMKRVIGMADRVIDAYPRATGMLFVLTVLGLVAAGIGTAIHVVG